MREMYDVVGTSVGYFEFAGSTSPTSSPDQTPIDVDQRDCVPLGLEDDHSMGYNRRKTKRGR